MRIENKALILDLVEWVGAGPRPYVEVMDAWRTSCPRLQIWEDTLNLGFLVCEHRADAGLIVEVTPLGRSFLQVERPDLHGRPLASHS